MNSKYTIVYIFTGFGFFTSLLASIASGASFKMVVLRVLLSSIVLSIVGFFFMFIADKFNSESEIISHSSYHNKQSSTSKYKNEENESYSDTILSDSLPNITPDNGKTPKVKESSEDLSYDNIFQALEQETMLENNMDLRTFQHVTNAKQVNNPVNVMNGIEKSVLDDIEQEYKDGKNEFIVDKDQINQVVEGDKDIQYNYLNESEMQQIAMTANQLHSSGNIKEIDDKFIHFQKESKIENNPKKIAQVIKDLMKEEEENK